MLGRKKRRTPPKKRILFLCTGNSCRSQMAEGWVRALKGDLLEARSAGVIAAGLDPRAVSVMREAGVDISRQKSKRMDSLRGEQFDYVVTVCDSARQHCPVYLGNAKVIHRGFDDPPSLSLGKEEEEALKIYRRVRDEIRAFVESLPEALERT